MCTGIILKDGRHLQSIKDIECHFQCSLEPYSVVDRSTLTNGCTCQVDLARFMSEPGRAGLFEYDHVNYNEK